MDFTKYIKDENNTEYLIRGIKEVYTPRGTKSRSREKQTFDNVVNFTLNDVFRSELTVYEDDYYLREFKGYSNSEQLSILKHMLRIQAYTIRKAIGNKKSIAIPYLGRFVYSRYKELSLQISKMLKSIESTATIKYFIRTTLTDMHRTVERQDRLERLQHRKEDIDLSLEDLVINRNQIHERYTAFKR